MRSRLAALLAAAVAAASSCTLQHGQPGSEEAPRTAALADTRSLGEPGISPLLDTGRTITDEAIRYPSSPLPQVVAQTIVLEPGQSTGWHRHGVPTFGHILSGTLEVEYATTGRRVLKAGDSLMESMNVAHNAVNLGPEPVRILVVFMGAQGKPAVVKTDPPAMPAGLGGSRTSELVELASVDPDLHFDIRYATANNFTGKPVYAVARAMMQKPAAEALRRADRRAHDAGYGLLVLDAYRPWSVTRMFWDRYPMHRAYLADPLAGSRHNRGCAVDLTLFDLASGREVPMPSAYDDFSERAHPAYAGGTAAERKARDLLRTLMEAEGFTVYENEWWHFDYAGWKDWPVLDVPLDSKDLRER
ncbi:MAG TPA: M15 family metallopeptidase [Candidatus Limnocylindrales bacterium]|nr:M15 family metallopeptidase [Candidatus Limnocylindrales bacterium]